MKEIKEIPMVYSEKYDINIKPFLTLAEIQAIANAISPNMSWAERRQIVDGCLLKFCTDMTDEDLATPHDLLYACGLIDEVATHVSNVYEITNAIDYESSWTKLLAAFVKEQLPKIEAQVKANGRVQK